MLGWSSRQLAEDQYIHDWLVRFFMDLYVAALIGDTLVELKPHYLRSFSRTLAYQFVALH